MLKLLLNIPSYSGLCQFSDIVLQISEKRLDTTLNLVKLAFVYQKHTLTKPSRSCSLRLVFVWECECEIDFFPRPDQLPIGSHCRSWFAFAGTL